jgi:hypothetical protein
MLKKTLVAGGGASAAFLSFLLIPNTSLAHGIAGNRYFPGTLTFDDPAVADELVFGYSFLKRPVEDGTLATDDTVPLTFVRLLTPDIAFGIDTAGIVRNRSGLPQQAGFYNVDLTLKALLYRSDPHETLISAAISWQIGGTGNPAVGGGKPDILQPGIFWGRGFGDLPDSLAWFRPFGIAGAVTVELPTRDTTTIVGVDPLTDRFGPMVTRLPDTVHWGFALEYSTLYLTDRFTGGPPKKEPLNQWVPLVEFAFDSPLGAKTAATANPGLSYVAVAWQLAGEAIIPLNREGGHGVGFRAQLLFFLDEVSPLFAKPMFSSQPVVSRVEKFPN